MNKNYPFGVYWGFNPEDEKIESHDKKEREIIIYEDGNLAYGLSSRLFKERIITFYEPVMPHSANDLKEKLLVLDKIPQDGKEYEDITLYIDSPGGSLLSLFGIYDIMQHITSNIKTVCVGLAASAASIMLTAGAKGNRYALPDSWIMVHELSSMGGGRHSEMKIGSDLLKKLEDKLLDTYIKHARYDETGEYIYGYGGDPHSYHVEDVKPEKMKPQDAKEWLRSWMERDRWLSTEQAQAMGFIDHIVQIKIPEKKK